MYHTIITPHNFLTPSYLTQPLSFPATGRSNGPFGLREPGSRRRLPRPGSYRREPGHQRIYVLRARLSTHRGPPGGGPLLDPVFPAPGHRGHGNKGQCGGRQQHHEHEGNGSGSKLDATHAGLHRAEGLRTHPRAVKHRVFVAPEAARFVVR